MKWDRDAEEYLKRIPFFVRGKVRREVEKYLSSKGLERITLADLMDAKEALMDRISKAEKGYEVFGCFGMESCANALVNSKDLMEAIERILEEEGITEFLKEKVKGPLKAHNKFKVGFSECPNCCSQIQIADFCLHGVTLFEVDPKKCSFCGSCTEVCEESAIVLNDYGPIVNEDLCVGCGHCLKICPEEALKEVFRGYKIYLGGKLGRHPRLATFLTYATPDEAVRVFQAVLRLYKNLNIKGERLGTIIERVGWANFKEMLKY
ncbi:MAG: 4Fe-4S binding protein [Caldimicrobium sp.]|nr:4Fe-4S binding protein [Caldimicrobium sp.]MCX7612699.1 4Fe-4S binding protein [Caldimicrobium sp.]MDW8182441.1 4Fe-4S binding protein [Caldimicrobium sp.]